ncbi:dolichyl-phosphate-mannose--protein mannosyltransferase [Demequina zhanjiangensis]|uniref:Polyprenol-phosphate-mannose--protein mannosyltransferase n=1 Tax=Demequina zhanjiangensis TaxID=3051659 RepID=A0ABT8G4X9_9MICO|nr:phospholipid carrier-dependent glycosyltransferase [Demequina sp. SYSU T00b26]MDN4474196.1 phospholipid carrier-dependent glycosyltransferase [Demequina sp. SYSU T00b26]
MIWGWAYRWRVQLMAVGVGLVAAVLRFMTLAYPTKLVFDEVYYARGAFSLLVYGYEGNWTGDDQAFASGDYSGLWSEGDYVVHPMVGKLLIALGIKMFGPTPFGWRFMIAVVGVATVVMTALIARTVLKSTLFGGIAGLLLALDGLHIVMSRTALLDGFLAFFVVAAFGLLVWDRERFRRRLDAAMDAARAEGRDPTLGYGPDMGVRWMRLAAIVTLGLAVATKWSGGYFAAVFMVMTIVWDMSARRSAGIERWFAGSVWRGIPTFFATVILIPAVYVATWWNWFATDGSYARSWAADHPGEGVTWLPEALRSLVEYHRQMWDFHTGLTTPHNYASNPWGWLLQLRPTAFWFEDVEGVNCGAERCVTAITSIGNVAIWWVGIAALLFALWRLIRHRDTTGFVLSLGVWAGWLPWLPYSYRTIFTFYAVVFVPFLVMVIAWALQRIAQPHGPGTWSRTGVAIVGIYVGIVVIVAGYFLPLWTGNPIPYDYWRMHMWSRPWI